MTRAFASSASRELDATLKLSVQTAAAEAKARAELAELEIEELDHLDLTR